MNKKYITIRIVCILAFLSTFLYSDGLKINTIAPFFTIKSGDDKLLALDMIKGKTTIVYYDTRDVVERNKILKDEVKVFYHKNPDKIRVLPIIDCTSAFWPISKIYKKKLSENSKKHGFIIYGDWDGNMKSIYKIKENESNVLIIDNEGIIRYFFSGRLENKEIDEFINLLMELIGEKKSR